MARYTFWAPILSFLADVNVAITGLHFCRVLCGQNCPICHWNFRTMCHSSKDTNMSSFGGHIAISGCWLMLPSLAICFFFELYVVVNPRFAVGNSMLISSSFRNLSISSFGGHFRLSVIIGIACRYCLWACCGQKPGNCCWNFDDICCTFGDISTFCLGGHIAISSCPSFLRATAYMLSAHMLSQFRPSVCLSVCLSVTRVIHAKTVVVRIVQFSTYSSAITLVFARWVSSRNSKGFPLNGAVKQGWGRKKSQFSANNSPYLRNGAR